MVTYSFNSKEENLIQSGSEDGFANHNSAYLGPVVEVR